MTERKEEENMKGKRVENKEGKIEGNNSKLNASCYYKRREGLFDITEYCIISDFVYNFRHLRSFVLHKHFAIF